MKKLSLTAAAVLCSALGAFSMTGKSVSIVYQLHNPGQTVVANSYRLVVATITNNSITRRDTLLKGGPMDFPAFSNDGNYVAFYKSGAGVSVISTAGTGLRTLARTVDWGDPDDEQSIYWPGADDSKWVYYHKPCDNGCNLRGSGEIWRVNIDDTTRNQFICDYKLRNDAITQNGPRPVMLKFSLTTDARYACIHTYAGGDPITYTLLGYKDGIIPHSFPPTCNPGTTQINPRLTMPSNPSGGGVPDGGCNSGLSASGSVIWAFEGGHDKTSAWKWDHTNNTNGRTPVGSWGVDKCLGIWTDVDLWVRKNTDAGYVDIMDAYDAQGSAMVYPRGSCNADRVMSVLINYKGGASHLGAGNNLMVAHWKNQEAIMPTMHRYVPEPGDAWNSDPGDFWLAGGPAHSYQDFDGNWQSLDGVVANIPADGTTAPQHRARLQRGSEIAGSAMLYTLRGESIGRYSAGSLTPQALSRLARGMLIVRSAATGSDDRFCTALR